MSSKPAAIPLFADSYLADTMHLSTEEHGAYLLMLMAAWRFDDCGLPNDDKKIARIVGLSVRRWGQIRDTILEFWTTDGDRIFNVRLRKERGYVLQKSASNRENARKRWETQTTENKHSDECERISDGNAPPPPPTIEEPKGPSMDKPHEPAKRTREPSGTRLPQDWEPILTTAAQRAVAAWPPGKFDQELSRFRDHAADKGRTSKDWQAAFRTWITKANEWMNSNGTASRHHPAPDEPRNPFVRAAAERQAERAAGFVG